MASLVVLPRRTDAFSSYKPSKNAHTDFLTPQSSSSSSKVVRLDLQQRGNAVATQIQAITEAITAILDGKPISASYRTLADTCRRLAVGDELAKLATPLDQAASRTVERLRREIRGAVMSGDSKGIDKIVELWNVLDERIGLLSSVLVYFDRLNVKDGSAVKSIRERVLDHIEEIIWGDPVIMDRIRAEISTWVASERDTGEPDATKRGVMLAFTSVAKALGPKAFATITAPYIEDAPETFSQLAETKVADCASEKLTGSDYVEFALNMEAAEKERAATVFSSQTADEVVAIVRKKLGAEVAEQIVRKAVDEAMYRADTEALSRLYTFCTQSSAFPALTKALQQHIESRIRTLISDPANDPQMIESTLKLKRFVDRAVASLFSAQVKPIQARKTLSDVTIIGDEEVPEVDIQERRRQLELEDAVRQGFKAGLGSRQNAPAEWIAKHLDAVMRKGQRSTSETEFSGLLDEIIALVGFTPDKDVFRAFYSSGLAKRLLLNKSASDDMERNMIVKLQNEMGDEFTSGDVMMKDLQLSETLVKAYQSARAKNPNEFKDHSDFTANVLTESAWPPYPLLNEGWDFKLTPELQSSVDTFTTWYATQHQNRKLSWRHQLATAILTARFDSGKYEIGVSLFQAVVLLQFNDVDVLDFKEIKARTGIESAELVRTLQSLALGRKGTRVLLKRPAVKEVEPTDKFAINKAFTSDRIKFKINQIQQDLSAEESRQTNEQVAIDRVSVLEATIVRIMKGRKRMTLQLLIDAVVSDVSKRFPPDVREIKKRVESLIEREFLSRDDEDRNTLNYLA